MRKTLGLSTVLLLLISCATQRRAITSPEIPIASLRLMDVQEIPHNKMFKGTTVGGLSGIDYDSTQQLYYLISDDRSALQPARFYSLKIHFNGSKIDSVQMLDVITLLQPDGKPYPGSKQDPFHAPDPEAMRYDPVRKQLIWTSEGERIVSKKDTVLANPSITIITPEGKFIDSFPLPVNLRMTAEEKGPRRNGVLEGLSFADHFNTVYVSLEEPRYEDGPQADVQPNEAWIRIYKFNRKDKKNIDQYAYKLDPVAYPAFPLKEFKINGIPDILYAGGNKLLVMERSYSTGRLACTIKIFETNLSEASDISSVNSLKKDPPSHPLHKKLLLNMDNLGIYVDNVEGMTFGPTLPNGHKTLVLIADNNFSEMEKTQVFFFEILP